MHLINNPGTDMVYCDMEQIDEDGAITGYINANDPNNLSDDNCVLGCFLYRRKVYQVIGSYDPDMFLVEDYDYWLRVRKQFKMDYLQGYAPYLYRKHRASLTCKRDVDIVFQRMRVQCKHVHPRDQIANQAWLAYWSAIWVCRKHLDFFRALGFATRCVATKPWRVRAWRTLAGTAARYFCHRLKCQV